MKPVLNNCITVFLLLLYVLVLSSCEKEDMDSGPGNAGYSVGVFISCEGSFNAGNGSISWYDPETGEIVNNLFEKVNGRPTGDVVHSFAIAGDKGVIVANNSQKIEVVDLKSFESVTTITDFSYPRYFLYEGKDAGYLSDGSMDGHVYRIDLQEGIVTDTIEVGSGPEQLVMSGHYLFVANSGGWGYDNTVSVIDTRITEVVNTITVGDIPVALVTDRDENIWVLCRGKVVYNEDWTEITDETDSEIVRINVKDMTVDRRIVTGQKGDYFNPSWLSVSPGGETLYFGEAEGLYAMGIDEHEQPAEPLAGKNFTAAGIHPGTGNLFALELTDFTSPGLLHIYEGDALLSTLETGIGPGSIVFSP
jgi:YVTN family beta-propeller protein